MSRRLPIGVELLSGGAHVRVWAPDHDKVTLVVEGGGSHLLQREDGGYHAAAIAELRDGTRYRFRLGDREDLYSDPASRYQPSGPFGPSQVVDPSRFAWSDAAWRGIPPERHVLYELHVGTFTPAGTWAAAAEYLGFLADVGITTLEIMPVHEFAGGHGWGYDGVNLFAPFHGYGTPDDFRRFVDRAHATGLAVILDVVYNHFGPAGNYMFTWAKAYRADRSNDWGDSLNFEGPQSARELVISNAGYWIDEFHLDGLRIDATQTIHDRSEDHVIAALARRAREAGGSRSIFLVGENEPQDAALLAPPFSLDALWNDDFHHSARVAACGVVDGYLHDYRASPQEFVSAIKRGFLYQGQLYPWQRNPRGTPTRGLARRHFVHFLENHDQVANLGFGERLAERAHPGTLRALTAVLLLSPELPMLFQGQEVGARQPWLYFADHGRDLHDAVRTGRAKFMAQFQAFATPEVQTRLPDPVAAETFQRCVLDPSARQRDAPTVQLYRDLLRMRREEPAFTDPRLDALDGAVLGECVFAIRYFQDDPSSDRLLLVNLGPSFTAAVVPEPLIAPPPGTGWKLTWSSEDPRYGGFGTPPPFTRARLAIAGHAALVLAPDPVASLREDLTAEQVNAPHDL